MARHDFTDMLYTMLTDIASELAETLTTYPDALPDSICAVGEVADFEKVKDYLEELLHEGNIGALEDLLTAAEHEAASEDLEATEEVEEVTCGNTISLP